MATGAHIALICNVVSKRIKIKLTRKIAQVSG